MDANTDLYPSRLAPQPVILERQDPVLHAPAAARADGPLTAGQLTGFERDGFVFLENVFDAGEVATLKEELDRLWAWAADAAAETVVREPHSRTVRSIFAVHRDNPTFRNLAADPRLRRAAEQILGSPVYVHQSRINYKPGFRGKDFYWHSDFETWHVEDGMPRMRALSMSIALTPNTPHNGPLMVIPGSHRHYVACVGETPENHYKMSLRSQEYGVPDDDSLAWLVEQGSIAAPVPQAGSVIIFDCNMMHGSNSNITPMPRTNVFFVYNSVENALVEPFGGIARRPEFIASRDFTPVGG